jgi:GT2 family glycosyltransferase
MKQALTAIIPTMLNDLGLFYLVKKLTEDKIPTIIIDNQPNTKKRDLKNNPMLSYLPQNKNLGFAAAVNLGARTAKTDWLLVLNDDIELSKVSFRERRRFSRNETANSFSQLLTALIDYAQQNKLVAVSPVLVNKQARVENYGYRVLPYGKVELNLDPKISLFGNGTQSLSRNGKFANGSIDGLTAACLLIKRDVFLKANGFDEKFFAYLEDIDLFLTLKEQNYAFAVCPKLSIIHNHLTTSSKLRPGFKQKQDLRNWILLSMKHPNLFKLNLLYLIERLRNFSGLIKALFP